MFLNWLHTLSDLQIGFLFGGGGLLVAVVLPLVIKIKYKLTVPDELSTGALDAYKILCGLTIALCVFSLVRVQSSHLNTEDLVSREAQAISKLNRDLKSMATHEAEAFRDDLNTYANLIVQDEWPAMAKGESSEKVSELSAEMTQELREIKVRTYSQQVARAEILATFKQVVDLRDARLADFKKSLPVYLWVALSCLIALMIISGWFEKRTFFTVAFTSGTVLGIAVLLTLLVALDGVLAGENKITPEPIVDILPQLIANNPSVVK